MGGDDFLFSMWKLFQFSMDFFSTFSIVVVTIHFPSLCLFQHAAALFSALWLAGQLAPLQAWAWHLLVEL